MNKSKRYHVYGRHNKPYRFFFRLLMLYLLISVAFFMYRDSSNFCTLSDAIIKRDALSLFIVSFMVSSLYFYYHGYCSTSPEHPLPSHHPLHKLQQNSTLFFLHEMEFNSHCVFNSCCIWYWKHTHHTLFIHVFVCHYYVDTFSVFVICSGSSSFIDYYSMVCGITLLSYL